MIAVTQLGRRPAWHRQATGKLLAALLATGVVSSLAGCVQDPFGPAVNLYHNLQGGEIAQQRPPPPGAHDPYPNLGTTPARPPPPDIATEQRIADELAAERDAQQRLAAANPLVVVQPVAATKPAAPDPNANQVTVAGADAPPPAPAPAPRKLAAPAPSPFDQVPAVPDAIASGPLPSFAAAAPPPPTGLGVVLPPAPAAPAPVPVPAAKPPANTILVAFTPGSATLPPSANLNLRRFALAHKGAGVTVTGHGEAANRTPEAQADALKLALQRAQAMAAALGEAGVSAANLHLQADAAGTGGTATL